MNAKNKNRLDLLKMSSNERIQLINGVKEKLRRKIMEAKLLQSLIEVENLTINGSIVHREGQQLAGFSLKDRV